jgi:triosephosphate isomerase (TIM)
MDGGGKEIWIIANWKSNLSLSESLDWINKVGPKVNKGSNLRVVVCPRFSALSEISHEVLVNNYPLLVGSQDLSPFDVGSFTGEEPASLIKEVAKISIIGHSERRKNFGETDEMIEEKIKKARSARIEPVLCIQDETTPIPSSVEIVAYEPVFAIGTGIPDTPENAEKVASAVKEGRENLKILYGGSVTSENCKSFISQENINGLLIGKSSLNPYEFLKIIENCNTV